jgi:Domain of unknown function (DUF4439)
MPVYRRDTVPASTAAGRAIIASMPANGRMPASWSRRSLLVALAAGPLTALSGCQVQLEEGARQVPLVPTRVPMKDEKALLAVLGRTATLGSLATTVGGASTSMTGRLSAVHATQLDVIARLLRDGGVPESLIDAERLTTSATAPATSASPTRPPLAPAAALSAAERSSVSDISLADLSTAHVAVVGSLLAQRVAAVTMLGGRAAPVVPSGLKGAEALRLLAATRASVYGFEIVAAQIDSTRRALAMSTLSSLGSRASELQTLVGTSAGPRPLGYQLPFPVTSTGSARRLALHLLAALLTSQAAALGPATGNANALATLVQWLGATEAAAARWSAPLAAFPGLTNG